MLNTNNRLKRKGPKRAHLKVGVDCNNFGSVGRMSQEIKRKDGSSSSEPTKIHKCKLKGGKAIIPLSDSSQTPLQMQESDEEEEEGEIMIIFPLQPPSNKEFSTKRNHSWMSYNDVDSFSTVFPPTIPISKVNMWALPISFATPMFTIEQCENLENVLDDFPIVARVNCLKEIMIDSWEKLQNIMLPTTLIKLHVQSCSTLERIAGTGDLTNLRELIIK